MEVHVLEAAASRTAYAWLLCAPIGDFSLIDCEVSSNLRTRLAAPILDPRSTKCVTAAGFAPKRCTLTGVARGNATWHAMSCKCGGHSISTHDCARVGLSRLSRSWTLPTSEETHDFMRGTGAKKMDIVAPSAGVGRGVLAIDLTRLFGASFAELAAKE